MATFTSALTNVKAQFSQLIPDAMILNACIELNHHWRKRKLDPVMTVHLLLLQLLSGVALIRLDRVAQLGVSAVAVCRARAKLPLAVWMKLAEWTGRSCRECGKIAKYMGHRVVLGDGTGLTTPDTPELAKKYGKASNQKKTKPGYPVVKLLALMDYATGSIAKVIDIPHVRNEQLVLTRMLKWLMPGDLLLADRGLVSFAHLACFMQAKVHCLMRLPRPLVVHGRGKGLRKRQEQLGRQDMLVRWEKPRQHKLKWLSKQRWNKLPKFLTLRQISFKLYRKGFRPHWVWVITTLVNSKKYTAQSLADLYGKRWKIELGFRDLKTSLKMKHLSAKTVDGVKKQILAFVILYNLVRCLMKTAAEKQKVPPDRISFIDTATTLLWLAADTPMPALKVNPKRKRPSQPRARKHGGYQYPVLKASREELQRPPANAVIGNAKGLS
jgi:Transposase DDE domain